MSLTPAFEIGLGNAWSFMLLYVLIVYSLPSMVNREAAKKVFTPPPCNKTEKIICCIGMDIYFISLIYTIFLSRFMIDSLFFS